MTSTNTNIIQILKKRKETSFRYHIAIFKLLRFVSPTGVEIFNSNGPMTVEATFTYPIDTKANLEKAKKFLFDNSKDSIIKDCIDKALENPDIIPLTKIRCKQEFKLAEGVDEEEKLINLLISFADLKYNDFLIMGVIPLKS